MRLFFLSLLPLLFLGCVSASVINQSSIPEAKKTVFISLDNTEATVGSGGLVYGGVFISETNTASFNTLANRMLIKEHLSSKGYTVTSTKEKSDLVLFGGCESSTDKSVVTLVLADSQTEEEYCVLQGSYGAGWSLQGDIKGALKKALNLVPSV